MLMELKAKGEKDLFSPGQQGTLSHPVGGRSSRLGEVGTLISPLVIGPAELTAKSYLSSQLKH